MQHNPKITKPRHCWLAGFASVLPSCAVADNLAWKLVLVLTALRASRVLSLESIRNRGKPRSELRTLEALMRSNEDGYGVAAEAVIALFAVHAISPGFLLATFRQKQKTQNSRIKRVVLGLGFSIAGNEKTKKLFKKSPDFFTWFSDCSQKKKEKRRMMIQYFCSDFSSYSQIWLKYSYRLGVIATFSFSFSHIFFLK
jgi:hypothetical protein